MSTSSFIDLNIVKNLWSKWKRNFKRSSSPTRSPKSSSSPKIPSSLKKRVQLFLLNNASTLNFIMNPKDYPIPSLIQFAYVTLGVIGLAAVVFGTKYTFKTHLIPFLKKQIKHLLTWSKVSILEKYQTIEKEEFNRERVRELKKANLREAEEVEKEHSKSWYQKLKEIGNTIGNKVNKAAKGDLTGLAGDASSTLWESLSNPNEILSNKMLTTMWGAYLTGFKIPYFQSEITLDKVLLATAMKLLLIVFYFIREFIEKEIYGRDYDPFFIRIPNSILRSFYVLVYKKLSRGVNLDNLSKEDIETDIKGGKEELRNEKQHLRKHQREFNAKELEILNNLLVIRDLSQIITQKILTKDELESVTEPTSGTLVRIQKSLEQSQIPDDSDTDTDTEEEEEDNGIKSKGKNPTPKLYKYPSPTVFNTKQLYETFNGPIQIQRGFFYSTETPLDIKALKTWIIFGKEIQTFVELRSKILEEIKIYVSSLNNGQGQDEKNLNVVVDAQLNDSWVNLRENLISLKNFIVRYIQMPIMNIYTQFDKTYKKYSVKTLGQDNPTEVEISNDGSDEKQIFLPNEELQSYIKTHNNTDLMNILFYYFLSTEDKKNYKIFSKSDEDSNKIIRDLQVKGKVLRSIYVSTLTTLWDKHKNTLSACSLSCQLIINLLECIDALDLCVNVLQKYKLEKKIESDLKPYSLTKIFEDDGDEFNNYIKDNQNPADVKDILSYYSKNCKNSEISKHVSTFSICMCKLACNYQKLNQKPILFFKVNDQSTVDNYIKKLQRMYNCKKDCSKSSNAEDVPIIFCKDTGGKLDNLSAQPDIDIYDVKPIIFQNAEELIE